MRRISRLSLLFMVVLITVSVAPLPVHAQPFKFTSSTQYLWGDDLLGESQSILAQYLRFSYKPDDSPVSITGYGRVWKDFEGGTIRDDDLAGRLYYLFLEMNPSQVVSLRLGRQFMAFTAGNAIIDGVRVDLHNFSPVGLTLAGGRDVVFTLDSEHSRLGNYFVGVDLHLDRIKATQLGVSYVRKYDEWDRAREEFGFNARRFFRYFSPYAEVRYDRISESIDEAT